MDRRSRATHRYRMKPAVAHFDDGRLFSPTFNDYYAARDPVAETFHVHLQPANLLARTHRASTFSIFEFGFGAGINFLTISEEFLKQRSTGQRLRFISCEAFPLPLKLMGETLKGVSVDASLSAELLEFYPPPISGIYRRLFFDDRVELTLILADAETALAEFRAQDSIGIDAWILDGFAPDRNPEMWSHEILSSLASRTRPGGTLTTFSSAGLVRRCLEQSGFTVRRVEDTPFKRHTTVANLSLVTFQPQNIPRDITVVGGGFAGTATARALARRGVHVKVITPTGLVGDSSSGAPVTVVHPRLSASMETPAYVRTQSYFYSIPYLHPLVEHLSDGVVQFPGPNMTDSRLTDIVELLGENWADLLKAIEVPERTQENTLGATAYFPKSFAANGQTLCQRLVEISHVEMIAKTLDNPLTDGLVVYATGSASVLGELAQSWETLTIEGQLDWFRPKEGTIDLRSVQIQDGYLVPVGDCVAVGSTYEYTKWETYVPTTTNLRRLQQATKVQEWVHQKSFRARRVTTSDKLPIVGQIRPLVCVNLAHGSSGATSAPYCAEILASKICHEIAPLWLDCIETLHPDRFGERQLRRPNPLERHRR